jgi:hypothetical protein
MKNVDQNKSPSAVASSKPARPSAPHNGLPTLTRLERHSHPRQTGRIPLMDAIEERFAQIFSNDHKEIPARAVCGDDELMRERENRS